MIETITLLRNLGELVPPGRHGIYKFMYVVDLDLPTVFNGASGYMEFQKRYASLDAQLRGIGPFLRQYLIDKQGAIVFPNYELSLENGIALITLESSKEIDTNAIKEALDYASRNSTESSRKMIDSAKEEDKPHIIPRLELKFVWNK